MHRDPGHVGSKDRYRVDIHDGAARAVLDRWPQRVDRSRSGARVSDVEWQPTRLELEADSRSLRRLLDRLAELGACALPPFEVKTIGLHPTFVDLEIKATCTEVSAEWLLGSLPPPTQAQSEVLAAFEELLGKP